MQVQVQVHVLPSALQLQCTLAAIRTGARRSHARTIRHALRRVGADLVPNHGTSSPASNLELFQIAQRYPTFRFCKYLIITILRSNIDAMPTEKPLDRFKFQRVPRGPRPTEGARRSAILKFFFEFFFELQNRNVWRFRQNVPCSALEGRLCSKMKPKNVDFTYKHSTFHSASICI